MTLDPQAAAELSQEITLVTRALFAQMLPTTAANAVAGIRRPDHQVAAAAPLTTGVAAPVERPGAPVPPAQAHVEAAAPAAPAALPIPSAMPVPIPVHAPPVEPIREPVAEPTCVESLPMPGLAVPVLPAAELGVPDRTADEHAPPARTLGLSRRGTAVLEEIAFLDE